MHEFQRKTNIVFFQIIIVTAVFFAGFFYILANLYSKLSIIFNELFHRLETICGCANHLNFFNHFFLFTGLLLLTLLVILFVRNVFCEYFSLKKSTDKFVKDNIRKKRKFVSQKLKKASKLAGLDGRVLEIKTEKPIVFCFSFFRSIVCVSSKLVKNLSPDELLAVLLHEKMHIKNNEPLKLFFVKTVNKILFFVPGLKSLSEQYLVLSELAADELATNGFKKKSSLASALYKVIELEKNLIAKNCLTIPFFCVIEERIEKLENNGHKIKLRSPLLDFALGIIFLFFTFISFSFINLNLLGMENNSVGFCPGTLSMPDVPDNKCDISTESIICETQHDLQIDYFENCHESKSSFVNYRFPL